MAYVISVATGKGGAGKSSVTAGLADAFSMNGWRTAVIELDPQGDLSDDLGARDDPHHDDGEAVRAALVDAVPLVTGLTPRKNLTYFPGGRALGLESLGRYVGSGWDGLDGNLVEAIAPLHEDHHIILIDTPPALEALQHASLAAAQWLLVPTAADRSSLRALFSITTRMVQVESVNSDLRYLGVLLWNVPAAAKRIRAEVRAELDEILSGAVPLFDTTIRSAFATAYEGRRRGMLPSELAAAYEDTEPFWRALRAGRAPERVPSTATALAGEYAQLANEVLTRMKGS